MGVVRRWVFPAIRTLLVAAIAVALVKLAFFPDGEKPADPAVPMAELSDPVTTVQKGTIVNDVSASGSIVADDAAPVRSGAAGTVNKVQVAVGQAVGEGALLFDVKVETPRDPIQQTGPDGEVVVTEQKPKVTYVEVTAPIGGVVSELPVLTGQAVAIGDKVASVAPPTFSVTASLPAEQQYRLTARPTEATVTVKGGPAPFTCTGLTISTPPPTASDTQQGAAPQTGAASGAGSATVRCAVPAEVTVFPGLTATVTMSAGRAEGVLTVPTTAVKGSAQKGVVYVTGDDGTPVEKPVVLGLTDGTSVEITEGLAEGDSILEFVPGAPQSTGDGCAAMPDGGVVCTGPVGS
ncbi:hypothetical protein LLS1_16620 [Leifsonia sp. LS1]|uniref:efflux RND transporter periplasmic adaptor subunit n=1 Tax=Leifsonia sp. LS1 TaxID=2828483 RepID=UPI001CFF00EB|nr:HlyD family efflux transporter periplasmic adaptor subunit [Leifsonia sp. LS1]GIT79993.1 hypothetical protein LLS1_16620 [Leifsonia sp. LS1]